MGSSIATATIPPFVISLLLALVSLNLPSKFRAEYAHYPPPLPKKHKQSEPPVPQPSVSEPIVPYFPFVYIPIPSPSEKPYELSPSPPLKQPHSPFSNTLVPYFPFVYVPMPSPSQKPYEVAAPSPSPVFARPVVPYYPFRFPLPPPRKLLYPPPNPIGHLQSPSPLPPSPY